MSAARFDDVALRRDVIAYADHWHMSQRGLARTIGMSPGTVCRWLRGEARAGANLAAALAACCDLSLDSYIVGAES